MKRYILKLVDGKDQTTIQKWKLRKDNTYIIGRSDKVEIPIQQESISRKHAEICVLENSATIKDLGSANGTFVDDKVAKHNQIMFLKNGTKVYLGDSPNYLIVKEKERKAKVSEQSLQDQELDEEEEVQEKKTKEQKKMKKEKKEAKGEEEEEDVDQKKDKKKKKSSKQDQEDRERSRSYEKEKSKSSKNEQKEPEQKANSSVTKELNAQDKRKLLWQNKKTDNLESKAQIYGKVEANAEETNKFFKLLGFKSSADGKSSTSSAGVQNYFIKKSGSEKQTMINDLESQYYEGMKRKNGNKGGLGFN